MSSTSEYFQLAGITAGLPTDQRLAILTFLAETFSDSPVAQLNLSNNDLDTQCIQVLHPLFQRPTLRCLRLTNTRMSAERMTTLVVALTPNASRLKALTLDHNLIGPDGAVTIARLLPSCTALESLSYAGAHAREEGTRAVCQGLAVMAITNSKLLHLNLDGCTFKSGEEEDDPIHPLLEVLEASPILSTLVLRDGALESGGLERVCGALLTSGAKLNTLDLGCIGKIGPQGVAVAGAFLALQLETLQEFDFDTNELGDVGIDSLVAPFTGASCLRKLHLGSNEIGEAGARVLIDNHISSLKELFIDDNVDLPAWAVAHLQTMYATVVVDDKDEDEQALANVDEESSPFAAPKVTESTPTPLGQAACTPLFHQTAHEHTGLTTDFQRLCLDSPPRRPSGVFVALMPAALVHTPLLDPTASTFFSNNSDLHLFDEESPGGSATLDIANSAGDVLVGNAGKVVSLVEIFSVGNTNTNTDNDSDDTISL